MLSLLRNPLTLTILILAAILGLISVIFVVNRSDQDFERANQTAVELERNMTELQAQLDELQADHEGLLQETIALRMLSESVETAEESAATTSAEQGVTRFPYGRETYLATRLKHATRQYRRQRALNRHLASSLKEANERISVKLSGTDSLSGEKPNDSSSMNEEVQASAVTNDSEPSPAANRVARLQQELESAISEKQQSDARLSAAATTISYLEQQLNIAIAERQQADSEPSATPSQNVALKQELEIANNELQRSNQEIERLAGQIDDLQSGYDSERDYYERTIEGLVEKLNKTVALIVGSEDSGEPETKMTDSAETDSTQDQDSSETLPADRTSQLLARLGNLQERLSQMEVSASTLSDAESRITELDLQLSDSISRNVQLQEELINLTNKVDSLNTELQAAERRTENMETLAQTITQENEQLGQLIGDLRKTMDIRIAEKASEISELVSGYTVLEYSTDILFESGSVVLTAAGKEDLKEFADSIDSESFSERVVSVEGHTDNVPISGDLRTYYPTNWELSMARSAAATRYLVEQGVPADRIRAVGFGSRRPVASNETERGRRANRRIEIHLVPELQRTKN